MKSTKAEKKAYTMEDFEKGLMLAGYISPNTISEVKERNELEKYEKELKKQNQEFFFKRVVLAAEIAYQLHNEITFGHVKFQKMVYLCEHASQMNINDRYVKQVAGPYDRKFMHSIDKELQRNKWFKVERIIQNSKARFKYVPLEKCENYKNYYSSYFDTAEQKIAYLIELFKKVKTDTIEIVATIYGCLIELKEQHITINEENLLNGFYMWSEAKSRFQKEHVIATWKWMEEKNIVPIYS
jgi:hypothetical protein